MRRICQTCGREYQAGPRSRFCAECAAERKRAYQREYNRYRKFSPKPRRCAWCGIEFLPTDPRQGYYCSDACRAAVKLASKWLTDSGANRNRSLAEKTVEAGKQGLSYGQLQAKKWLEKQKEDEH